MRPSAPRRRAGAVELVTPASDPEMVQTLDRLMAQKAGNFARIGVGNLFAKPGYAELFCRLAGDAATRPLVHVSRHDVGALAAAINLGLVCRARYYHVLASYDDGEVACFGPGAAQLHDIMQYAIDQGCNVFDFTIGYESYKRDWCATELALFDHIAAATLRGALDVLRG